MTSLNTTYPPELTPEVLDRLRDEAELVRDDFRYQAQHSWSGVSRPGLLQDGARKRSVPRGAPGPRPPQRRDIQDPGPARQHVVNPSPWDDSQQVGKGSRRVQAQSVARPRGIVVIAATGSPTPGQHAVGGQRPDCGQGGKTATGQGAVTAPYLSPERPFPAAVRLSVPTSWTRPPAWPTAVGGPAEGRRERTTGPIALAWLDQLRAERLLAGAVVITEAGDGVSPPVRQGRKRCQWGSIAGVTAAMVVVTAEPGWVGPGPALRGRPRSNPPRADDRPRPVCLKSRADRRPRDQVTWRAGTPGTLAAPFASVRLWPAPDGVRGGCVGADPLWLVIAERADGPLQSAFSTVPACPSRIPAVRLWKRRGPVEQGSSPRTVEWGLKPVAGRSWRGFHHQAGLVMLASGFLVLDQRRVQGALVPPGTKRRPTAQEHRPGDPPRRAAPPPAAGSAGV